MEITASAVSLETIYGYHVRRRGTGRGDVKVSYWSEYNWNFSRVGIWVWEYDKGKRYGRDILSGFEYEFGLVFAKFRKILKEGNFTIGT